MKKYSVLLMYPDYISDTAETFYTFVTAQNRKAAILKAQKECKAESFISLDSLDDLRVILVIDGHRKESK